MALSYTQPRAHLYLAKIYDITHLRRVTHELPYRKYLPEATTETHKQFLQATGKVDYNPTNNYMFQALFQENTEALTNLIQLVRFAWQKIERLESLCAGAHQRFSLWYGQMQREVTAEQIELMKQIVDYIAANGTCLITDIKEYDKTFAAKLVTAYQGKDNADTALLSLARFIIYRKIA